MPTRSPKLFLPVILTHLTHSLRSGYVLNQTECAQAIDALLDDQISDSDKAIFLTSQMERGLREAELVGFAQAILPRARASNFTKRWQGSDIIDCCGTGGGGLNILNISTGIVFILAAAGVPVVKHGNRGMTKKSGSADVLEALGLKIEQSPTQLEASMQELGWGFVFAPHYHPSFKAISNVRKKLGETGQKSIFNFLGPLINPVRPNAQLVGVFDEKLLELYYSSLRHLDCDKPCVVFGMDETQRPLGEVSHHTNVFCPSSFQTPLVSIALEGLETIRVENAVESASKLERIFRLEETGLGYRLLIENAAVAFWVQGRSCNREEGVQLAKEIIASKAAYRLLQRSRQWAITQK